MRTFVYRGLGMLTLLREVGAQGPDDEYVQQLVDAFAGKRSAGAGGEVAASAGPLGNHETDVLLMLAKRLFNKEIPERLFVASDTVKKYMDNILSKLDAHDQREAVAIARKLRLIPSADSDEA